MKLSELKGVVREILPENYQLKPNQQKNRDNIKKLEL